MGNHDMSLVEKGLEDVVTFLGNGKVEEVGGIRFAGRPACYEKTPLGMLVPDLFGHLEDYVGITDEDVKRNPFEDDSGVEDADVYLFHRPILDEACEGEKHDKEARRLVEIAILRGKEPLVLSGHFHGFKSGGAGNGVFQIRGGKNYVFEIDLNEDTKEIEEIVIYRYTAKEEQIPVQEPEAIAAEPDYAMAA